MMYEEGEGERKANVNQEKSRLGGGYIIEPSPAAHETLYVTVHSVQCSDNNKRRCRITSCRTECNNQRFIMKTMSN